MQVFLEHVNPAGISNFTVVLVCKTFSLFISVIVERFLHQSKLELKSDFSLDFKCKMYFRKYNLTLHFAQMQTRIESCISATHHLSHLLGYYLRDFCISFVLFDKSFQGNICQTVSIGSPWKNWKNTDFFSISLKPTPTKVL